MRLVPTLSFVAVFAFSLSAPAAANAQDARRFTLELEGGAVGQSRNDVRIPNDAASTRFSLSSLAGGGPWATGRVYATWHLHHRHDLRILLAPLSVTASGTPERAIRFAGVDYVAAVPISATYTFNSYRVTYRYQWKGGDATRAWIGFTAKLRDATIALEQGGTNSRKDNRGIVPLLHAAGDWRLRGNWRAVADVDALAGGPGRAIDAALKLGYESTGPWSVYGGYRTVEGGADVDEVYNFAWLHYAVVSARWTW